MTANPFLVASFTFFWMATVLGGEIERPNILWITSEDNSPYLGCYGDPQAQTPHLDRLASQGVRYRNAFANAPVCSTARTTLITGMYACSLGADNHRSRVRIPAEFKLYPEHLRAAGYYCSNNSKTDYNLANARQIWNESSPTAHYRNRAPGQPFFAVFNLTTTHESQVAPRNGKSQFRIPPDKVVLPPYHPDTPAIRRDWANYYDQLTRMDEQAGAIIDDLEKSGLEQDTIVFYFSDHGGALPRGKRNIHDSGTRVPLIVRVPRKWGNFAPANPGEWIEDPVSFVDLPPTLFRLAGVSIPDHYQGRPFLGLEKPQPRTHVFLFRARMDERYDTVRAIRDRDYRYVRNYSPHRPWGQQYSYPFEVLPSMASWRREFDAGRCNPLQARYWQTKPSEEFYSIRDDAFEIRDLMNDPAHADRIASMRAALRAEMVSIRDTGFIPEGMRARLGGEKTIYNYAQSSAYPIERVIDVADLAVSRSAGRLPDLIKALNDEHPVIRYWGAVGCLVLQSNALPAKPQLLTSLDDDSADVRIAAAEALSYMGEAERALDAIESTLEQSNQYEVLAALNSLEFMWRAGHVTLERVRSIVSELELSEPASRIRKFFAEEAQ